jgi:hypothetical protein
MSNPTTLSFRPSERRNFNRRNVIIDPRPPEFERRAATSFEPATSTNRRQQVYHNIRFHQPDETFREWERLVMGLVVIGLLTLSATSFLDLAWMRAANALSPIAGPGASPMYRWHGFHRVAP